MPKKIAKGFTILELLVVLAVMGVFAVVAYPNISKWIIDREVKKEVYDVVEFIKDRKSEIDSGQYGMTQILLNRQMEVFTMSQEDFVYKYKSISSPNTSFKKNRTCGFAHNGGFKKRSDLERIKLSSDNSDSAVHIYPSAWHNPMRTAICITKDGTISYYRLNQNARRRDDATRKMVDYFMFCSKSNSTQKTCKYNSNLDHRYLITLDRFQNIKIFKYNKKKNKWNKIDG